MHSIEQSYTIQAPIATVWQTFIDPELIEKWGAGPAIMCDKEGVEFSLWGGEIYGTNTKIVPQKLIEQDWYSGDAWKEPSKVILTFTSQGNTTTVHLMQDQVPADEVAEIDQGWKEFYFGPLVEFVQRV